MSKLVFDVTMVSISCNQFELLFEFDQIDWLFESLRAILKFKRSNSNLHVVFLSEVLKWEQQQLLKLANVLKFRFYIIPDHQRKKIVP